MRQFLTFVKKEFYHILRDPRTIMILLLMPIIQIILFGFALSTDIRNVNIAILDNSKDGVTTQMIEKLSSSSYFHVTKMIYSEREIEELMQSGRAGIVVVFGDNFEESVIHEGRGSVEVIVDGTDPNTAATILNYTSSIMGSAAADIPGVSQNSITINPQVRMLFNPQMKSAYNFVPGVMGLILLLICTMMTSISIVREKETGTMEVLLVSPMRPIYIILSKAVPYFVVSMVNLTTILLLSRFVLGIPIEGSLFWLIAISLIYIFVALSIGLLVSTITETQVAAMLISGMVFMMPVILLSGMIFPTSNMPEILQWISQIIPAKWYIASVRKIMIEGLSIGSVLQEVGVLMFMGAVVLIISLKKFKQRLG